MLVPGTFRLKSVLCGPTLNASTAAAMTKVTVTRTSCPWTTVCKVFWDSGSICLRTSKWTMIYGWSGRSSQNPFHGKNCYSEKQQPSTSLWFLFLNKTVRISSSEKNTNSALRDQTLMMKALNYMFVTDWRWLMGFTHTGVKPLQFDRGSNQILLPSLFPAEGKLISNSHVSNSDPGSLHHTTFTLYGKKVYLEWISCCIVSERRDSRQNISCVYILSLNMIRMRWRHVSLFNRHYLKQIHFCLLDLTFVVLLRLHMIWVSFTAVCAASTSLPWDHWGEHSHMNIQTWISSHH